MAEEDQSSKTEEPTQKKLDDALEKGQVVNSKEVTSFIMFTLFTFVAIWFLPSTMHLVAMKLRYLIENAGSMQVDPGLFYDLLPYYIKKIFLYLSPVFSIIIIAAIFSSFAQTGTFIFTAEPMKPDISKLSIAKGFKRIVSIKSLVEFLKGIFKIALVGTVVVLVIMADIKELSQYQELSLAGILDQLQTMIYHILIAVTILIAAIAGVDFSFQKYDHYNKLKMTKQEVKDEYKQTEGNPEIKQKIRQLRSEQTKKRITQTVPEATVIITNPEHYAVALKYDMMNMEAPICVAKGVEMIAQNIKKIAGEYDIPIVENPPLARGLFKDTNIDEEIPIEYYEAVAEVIMYIMQLEEQRKQRRKNG